MKTRVTARLQKKVRLEITKKIVFGMAAVAVYFASPTTWNKPLTGPVIMVARAEGSEKISFTGGKDASGVEAEAGESKAAKPDTYFIDHYVMTTFNTEDAVGMDILWFPFLPEAAELTLSDVEIISNGTVIDSIEAPQKLRTKTTITRIYIRYSQISGPLQAGTRVNFTLTAANGDRMEISHSI